MGVEGDERCNGENEERMKPVSDALAHGARFRCNDNPMHTFCGELESKLGREEDRLPRKCRSIRLDGAERLEFELEERRGIGSTPRQRRNHLSQHKYKSRSEPCRASKCAVETTNNAQSKCVRICARCSSLT